MQEANEWRQSAISLCLPDEDSPGVNSVDDPQRGMKKKQREARQRVKLEEADRGNPGYLILQPEPERNRKPHPRGEQQGRSRPG